MSSPDTPTPASSPAPSPINAPALQASPPSRSVAAWLVITFLNIALFIFLVPDWIFASNQMTLLTKVLPALVAGGLFAAGLVWFKDVLVSLPERRWFKIANVIVLSLLIPLNVSQQNVVAIHPQIETNGYKFKVLVDNEERSYEGGDKMRLSIANHTVRIVPETEENEPQGSDQFPQMKEGKFTVSYADMVCGLFGDYHPHWGPLYLVTVSTPEPSVEVLIHKTDGDFDVAFTEHPPHTEDKNPFAAKSGSRTEFVYRGSDKQGGSIDHLYLPYGQYEFTASRPECSNKPQLTRKIGEDPLGYKVSKVSFDFLCQPRH